MNGRFRYRMGRSAGLLLLGCIILGLAACRSGEQSSATPVLQPTTNPIPMLTIATPTPGHIDAAAPTVTSQPTAGSEQAPNGENGHYTVQPGDTLFGIASKFHVTIDALMQANGISDATALQANQVLVIP